MSLPLPSTSVPLNTSCFPFSLPIEWILSENDISQNLCVLPAAAFENFDLCFQDWILIELSQNEKRKKSRLLCRCSVHSDPAKSFASIVGPTIQTCPDEIIDGIVGDFKPFKHDTLDRLLSFQFKILSTKLPLSEFQELEIPCKSLCVLREVEGSFIQSNFIIKTPTFLLKVLSTEPSSGGLITSFTQLQFYSDSFKTTLSTPNFSPTFLQEHDDVVASKLAQWVSSAFSRQTPAGIVFYGPPGVGKTYTVRNLVTQWGVHAVELHSSDFQTYQSGITESLLLDRFRVFVTGVRKGTPALLLIKSIDAFPAEIFSLLYTQLDALLHSNLPLVILATTHHFHLLPIPLIRSCRLDHHLAMDPPSPKQRHFLLQHFLQKCRILVEEEEEDLQWLSQMTSGYVAADLKSLVHLHPPGRFDRQACMKMLLQVPPSLTRQYFLNLDRSLTWDSIAGIDEVKEQLKKYVLWPRQYPEQYRKLGLTPPRGILLYGPPGCSKTTLSKILAVCSGYHFFALTSASIMDSSVGESERKLRACFELAEQISPSIIFLDELEVLGQRQGREDTKVMSTLLNLMDGIEKTQVLVLGATNYPDRLDPALIRAGRFDRLLYLGPPDLRGRKAILQYYLNKMKPPPSIELDHFARNLEYATGAEIENLCRQACLFALREKASQLTTSHLQRAVNEWKPFLTHETLAYYRKMQIRFSTS